MDIQKMKVGFIGAGNMASAIAQGLLTKKYLTASQLIVSAPSDRCFKKWREWGVKTTNENGLVLETADIIILAMKPYQLKSAFQNCQSNKEEYKFKIFVSVIAGITLADLSQIVIQPNSVIIRVIPNTPVLVGEGCSVLAHPQDIPPEVIKLVKNMFMSLGTCTIVPESVMSAVGGLAGCGPAFVYMIIEALSDGGVKQGIPRDMATTFAAQTLLGAAKMVLETGKHTGQLKDEVCSPGGTTICGVHALENGGLRATLMNAIEAAAKRSEEISRTASIENK